MMYLVNTDEPMSEDMMASLNRLESICAVTGVKEVSEERVHEFLNEIGRPDLSSQFKREYMR
jgi:hypothetical protein